MLISPIILVRLLPVEDFGRYREFLLYTGIFVSIAAFGINTSLLRFIPDRPESNWRFVSQASLMTLVSSLLVVGSMLVLNPLFDGGLVGVYAAPVACYVLLFVNLDFWESFWLASKHTRAVFAYTTGRLVARLVVVVTAAALTRDVNTIIWALVGLEAVRILMSFLFWRAQQAPTPPLVGSWREQLRFCLPFGASLVLVAFNRSMGSLFIAKSMGPVALAHYAIGTYVQPVLTVLRNSISDVLLPEMSAQSQKAQSDPLLLFRRTTVVTAILLFAAGVILARFADVFVTTLFSEKYRSAVPVLQIYLLVFVRESMDFGVPLRAINRTTLLLRSNLIAIVTNGALLTILLPSAGLPGAVVAFVISRSLEGLYLGWQTHRAYGVSVWALADWPDLAKVALAAALAAVVLYGSFWTDALGIIGALAGCFVYMLAYVALLVLLRVHAAGVLLQRARSLPRILLSRPHG